MPEGDTVWRTAQRLSAALTGERLVLAEIRWGEVEETPLRHAVVEEVLPRGKHLLHRVDTGWTLHTHLRMEGSWRVEAAGSPEAARALRRPHLRVALGTQRWTTLGLRLGMVDLVPREQEGRLVGHLGPDVLGPDWDPERVVTGLLERGRSSPGLPVVSALLDQRLLAGVGTFWASEMLFVEREHPWRPLGDVDATRLRELVDRVHLLMDRGKDHAVQSSTGVLRVGQEGYVHGRSGRPCRRCGTVLRVAMAGEAPQARTIFSCPSCQGGLAPGDDGLPQAPLGSRRTSDLDKRSGRRRRYG